MIADPDYPHIILAFPYRHYRIEIERTTWHGIPVFAAWVKHRWGCAIAVPKAWTRQEAVQRARSWVDRRLKQGYLP